jgi:uncharacterized protein (DUF1810 family)
MAGEDAYDLARFVTAQAPVYEQALGELRAGRKRSHWMWFVFPQLRDLGRSATAQFYGIGSLDEARAYLDHPVLGPRLAACTQAVLDCGAASLHALFGSPDDVKFRSSMTLFEIAAGDGGGQFRAALDRWCGGIADPATMALVCDA